MRMGKMALDSRETSGLVAVPVRLEVSGGGPSGTYLKNNYKTYTIL